MIRGNSVYLIFYWICQCLLVFANQKGRNMIIDSDYAQIKTKFVMTHNHIEFMSALLEFQGPLIWRVWPWNDFDTKTSTATPTFLCVKRMHTFYTCYMQNTTSQYSQWIWKEFIHTLLMLFQ